MRVFHCDHCQQLVFFENTRCVGCDHVLAFLPDVQRLASLEPAAAGEWRRPGQSLAYRLCENYERANVCNWAMPAADSERFCISCRLTRLIPDTSDSATQESWYRMEVAKRRLLYTLMNLGLPVRNKIDDPDGGLAFDFPAEVAAPDGSPVLTGHAGGVITISVAEADDAVREQRRVALHEPYRTLLGHFRHESGHYYWEQLLRDGELLDGWRQVFGDEREPYDAALRRHYDCGAPADWQQHFVSAYASVHPWEDWAETWAHYLHMSDAMETAGACGLALRPRRADEPALNAPANVGHGASFDRMIEEWFSLIYVLNNLNRGLGLADGYPFILTPPVVAKLRFVHDTVHACRGASPVQRHTEPHLDGSNVAAAGESRLAMPLVGAG